MTPPKPMPRLAVISTRHSAPSCCSIPIGLRPLTMLVITVPMIEPRMTASICSASRGSRRMRRLPAMVTTSMIDKPTHSALTSRSR
jgi:hypothetical protein